MTLKSEGRDPDIFGFSRLSQKGITVHRLHVHEHYYTFSGVLYLEMLFESDVKYVSWPGRKSIGRGLSHGFTNGMNSNGESYLC